MISENMVKVIVQKFIRRFDSTSVGEVYVLDSDLARAIKLALPRWTVAVKPIGYFENIPAGTRDIYLYIPKSEDKPIYAKHFKEVIVY